MGKINNEKLDSGDDHLTPVWITSDHLCSPLMLSLICPFFYPENGVSPVDSVFIFQNSAEKSADTSYDAIVVEQWTVVDVGLFNPLENMCKFIIDKLIA